MSPRSGPVILATALLIVGPALAMPAAAPDDGGPLPPGYDVQVEQGQRLTSYLHDVSQPIPGVNIDDAIVEHHRIPVPDRDEVPSEVYPDDTIMMDAWIARPPVDGPVPVVLQVTPYYGGGEPFGWGRLGEELVERGYAYGIVSVRGTGNSGGCFTQGGPGEAKDTAEVVDHVASANWSNGRVGMIGVSYPGTTPQDAWALGADHLETIVPIAGISDMYKYNFVNGVPIYIQGFGFNTYYWPLTGLTPVGLGGGIQATDPESMPGAIAGEACTDQVDVQQGGATSTVDGNKDAYWQARDFLAEYREAPDRDRPSVFYIHGLQDWNVKPHNMEDWLPAVQESGVPYKVWLGQWGHAWPRRADWWDDAMVAWFDRFLKERQTGILDAPAVQVEDDGRQWRHEATWPPENVTDVVLHPREDGRLATTPGSGEASYHDHFGDLAYSAGHLGPDRAVFVSEPLGHDLHLSGLVRFEGNVTASGHRASLMLSLAERSPFGSDSGLTWAAQSLNHVDSLESGQTSVAGQTQHVTVDFFPQDEVIEKGDRLVLKAAGNVILDDADGPSLQPVSSGSEITLHLDGAELTIPADTTLTLEPDPE